MKSQSATAVASPEAGALASDGKHPAAQPEAGAPSEPKAHAPLLDARGSAARCRHDTFCIDLLQEGANILELKLRQSRCLTPLSISSRATQAILNQF
jgi:hypothetical protein